MSITPESKEQLKELIEKKALELFSEKGYLGTNMQDIADALDITRGPLYYYYNNKADLYKSVIYSKLEDEYKQYEFIFSQNKNIFDIIKDDLKFCINQRLNRFKLFSNIENINELSEVSRHRLLYEKKIYELKEKRLTLEMEKGVLSNNVNIKYLVDFIFCFYYGISFLLNNSNYEIEMEEINVMIDEFVKFIKLSAL